MSPSRYRFEVIDTNGCCENAAEMLASDMTAVFDKVAEISDRIAQPGYRIRVKDQDGNAVFVRMTTLQGAEDQDRIDLE